MKKSLFIVLGFLMFILGVTSVILSMVGMNYTFLRFMTSWSPLLVFVIDICLILGGIIVVYLHATNWRNVKDQP